MMKYRRIKLDDQFLDVSFTTETGFTVPADSHIADIARALNVDDLTRFEAVESETDPARGDLIPVPAAQQPEEEITIEERIARLEASRVDIK